MIKVTKTHTEYYEIDEKEFVYWLTELLGSVGYEEVKDLEGIKYYLNEDDELWPICNPESYSTNDIQVEGIDEDWAHLLVLKLAQALEKDDDEDDEDY